MVKSSRNMMNYIINLFVQLVEYLCKSSCKNLCKLNAKICAKKFDPQILCKNVTLPQSFTNFLANLFTSRTNLSLSNIIHISTHPTITTTNNLNSNI